MRNVIIIILVASFAIMLPVSTVSAEIVSKDQALTVATNWIAFILQAKGDWGGAKTAEVIEIQEFKRGDRLLGYFCHVNPRGHIVISLRRELAPVKAYSATCNLDPGMEEGLVDLIKDGMERILDGIIQQIGPVETVRTEDMESILEIDYRQTWLAIENGVDMNYQMSDTLLNSSWHQGDPYNQQCPAPPGGDDCTAPRCLVGCVATAGAQIMRYWNWPPYDNHNPPNIYDWRNMPDQLTGSSPQIEIDVVADLCHNIGVDVGMSYCAGDGCQSSAQTYDMEGVYENLYRYSPDGGRSSRNQVSAVEWFNMIKNQLNMNRPIHYRVEGHSIVCDGWQETGPGPLREYHMNYGWGDGNNTWWTLGALLFGGIDEEYMLYGIFPNVSLGTSFSGTYARNDILPYRYFDRDALGTTAVFEAGQRLQFLPRITVTCAPGGGNYVRILSGAFSWTRLFTRGDISKGIRLAGGEVKFHPGGSLKLH